MSVFVHRDEAENTLATYCAHPATSLWQNQALASTATFRTCVHPNGSLTLRAHTATLDMEPRA